jgi:hypothetical protein
MELTNVPTRNLVNAVMDILFKTQGVTPSRRDYELLDKGWMGGVEGVLFFNGVAELKKRLDHMPIADLIVRERDDQRRADAAERRRVFEGGAADWQTPIMSQGKD